LFEPDWRDGKRQMCCPKKACWATLKAARQRRRLEQPRNRDYFRGAALIALRRAVASAFTLGVVFGAALRPRAARTAARNFGSRCANTDAVTIAGHTPRSRRSGDRCAGREGPEHPPAVKPVPAFASDAYRV
jgi:hypothetical protein